MKKRFLSIVALMSIMVSLLTINAYALEVTQYEASASKDGVAVVTRAEEVEWHYRYYNGAWQRRKWSITYDKWLTEWAYF